MIDVTTGIAVGGAGGAIAGVTLWLFEYSHRKAVEAIHKKRVYRWLKESTEGEDSNKFRSTRAIASWNNITEDRVRYICSIHDKIFLSTGQREDMWSVHGRGERTG